MFTLPRLVIGAVAAIVVIAVVAGGGWWFFIRDDAKLATSAPAIPSDLVKTPTAAATGASASASPAGAAAQTAQAAGVPTIDAGSSATGGSQTYTVLTDRSEAAYFADEKLASLPLPSTAKGTTKITGTFHLTSDGTALDTSQPSSFSVDLTGLASDKSMRDRRVQSTLETSTFRTATFTAESVTGFDPSITDGQEQTLVLQGTLDLHGVKKEITWAVKARKQGGVITALATVTFPFEDYSLSPPNIGGFVAVEDHITLQVQIVAQAQ